MVFLHGTATKPAKWDIAGQSFSHYIPTGKAVEKLNNWASQGAEICYLTSHEKAAGDDCESIGGEPEMTYPHIRADLKPKIKSIVVKEFQGIDHLPDSIEEL